VTRSVTPVRGPPTGPRGVTVPGTNAIRHRRGRPRRGHRGGPSGGEWGRVGPADRL